MELNRVVEDMQKEGSQPAKPPKTHRIIQKKGEDITKKWDLGNPLVSFWVGAIQIFSSGKGKVLKHYLGGKVNSKSSSISFD